MRDSTARTEPKVLETVPKRIAESIADVIGPAVAKPEPLRIWREPGRHA